MLLLLGSFSGAAEPEVVLLGEDRLTAGVVSGERVTLAELRAWLGDPKNHRTLAPRLPIGLDAGQSATVGLDANRLTRAKIELGRQLYFDPRLSIDGTVSCASCHDPSHSYATADQFGIGVEGQTGNRNSPTAMNRILSGPQFCDGRAPTLEAQAVGPIANPLEMGFTHAAAVKRLANIPGYRLQFEQLFDDGVTIDNAGRAIASFERVVVTGPSPWDHHARLVAFESAYAEDLEAGDPDLLAEHEALQRQSQQNPLVESARRGGELFFSQRTDCAACHAGANFTDELYHNLGVGLENPEDDATDWGRAVVTNNEADRGAFKTPTLRNIAQTAPYMHDGSQKTLAEVVTWYVEGGHDNPHLSERITPLDLDEQEQADLVAFLEALTGKLPKVNHKALPE